MNESLLTKLFVGAGTPIAAVLANYLQVFNEYMQTINLIAAFVVAVCTVVSFVRKKFK